MFPMTDLHTEEDWKVEQVRKTRRHQRYACKLLQEREFYFWKDLHAGQIFDSTNTIWPVINYIFIFRCLKSIMLKKERSRKRGGNKPILVSVTQSSGLLLLFIGYFVCVCKTFTCPGEFINYFFDCTIFLNLFIVFFSYGVWILNVCF